MFTWVAFLLATSAGLSASEMAALVRERLERLDRLVVEVTWETYGMKGPAPLLDQSRWTHRPMRDLPFRLTIVRPNALIEYLLDDPNFGAEPVTGSVFDGSYVEVSSRPNPSGRMVYMVHPCRVEAGVASMGPLLQVFDLHLYEAAIPQLNILRLLEEREAVCIRAAGGVYTYAASVRPEAEPAYTDYYEFDVNQRGTPLRVKSVLQPDDPERPAFTREQFVLVTREVNGAEFPMETVVRHTNQNVPNWHVFYVYRVTGVEVRDDLTPEDVRIGVERRNGVVIEYRALSGREPDRVTEYDESGQVIRCEEFYGIGPAPEELLGNSPARRRAIVVAAGGVGLLMALGVWLLAGHSARARMRR